MECPPRIAVGELDEAPQRSGASADTVDTAAAGLLGFAANVDTSADDPVLTVITGTGPSYRRADGVNVVAIGALGP